MPYKEKEIEKLYFTIGEVAQMFNVNTSHIRFWSKEFEVGVVGMVKGDPLRHQIEHFGAVIRGEAEPLVSARDGLQNLRVTEAIADAARTGQVVELSVQ